jgi:chromosome segregation ATPase
MNQCFTVNNDEFAEARSEAERLRGDMQYQETEFQKSRTLLHEKDAKLSEAEKLYEALLEKDIRILGANESMTLELESLRQQLSEEKKRSDLLKEKHQESRSRLNDAIKEQQDLFLRSRDLCKEALDQLQKEKAAKTLASDAVDKALEASQKKRAEMKQCLEEYRLQADKDIQQSKTSYSSVIRV